MQRAAGRKTGTDSLTVDTKINNAARSRQKDRKGFIDGRCKN